MYAYVLVMHACSCSGERGVKGLVRACVPACVHVHENLTAVICMWFPERFIATTHTTIVSLNH